MSKRKVPMAASFFMGSPLVFIVPAVLLQFGVSPWPGMAVGAVAAVLAGRAFLRSV
jgi:hypothetical protein